MMRDNRLGIRLSFAGVVLVALCLVTGSGSTAGAQTRSPDISGSYDTSGTKRDGSPYQGALEISPLGRDLYWLEWRDSGDGYSGRGVLVGKTLFTIWGSNQSRCIAALLEVGGDGILEGLWFRAEKRNLASSSIRAVPEAGGNGDISGVYSVTVDEPDGSTVRHDLRVRPLGGGYFRFRWTGAGGPGAEQLDGRGLLDGPEIQVVASIVESGGRCGESEMALADDGSLSGSWRINDENYRSLGRETAVPRPSPPGAAHAASTLFPESGVRAPAAED